MLNWMTVIVTVSIRTGLSRTLLKFENPNRSHVSGKLCIWTHIIYVIPETNIHFFQYLLRMITN